MERVIECRAMVFDTSEWVFGGYLRLGETAMILYVSNGNLQLSLVQPDTVGEFVGLVDSDGQKIYEGDILAHIIDDRLLKWKVIYQHGCFGIRNVGIDGYENHAEFFHIDSQYYFVGRKVIGNIHQNPELLK